MYFIHSFGRLILFTGAFLVLSCAAMQRSHTNHYTVRGSGDVEVAYEDRNPAGGGPELVLIHGWNGNRTYWKAQLDAFAAETRVVAIDLGGHGASGRDRDVWSIESFGQDVTAVVLHLGLKRAVLVGHSMGGPIALEAAARLPGQIIGVVGVDAFHDIASGPPEDLENRLAAFRQDFPTAVGELTPKFFNPHSDQALRERITRDMAEAPPEVAVPALESLARYDSAAGISRLDIPVATVNADNWPTDAAALRRARPGFELVIIEDAGHFLMMERPADFNAELRRIIEHWTAIASVDTEG